MSGAPIKVVYQRQPGINELLAECLRPWKLVFLAIGLLLLVVGSFFYRAPDWDIPVSFVMAGFTYMFAGWSMHMIVGRRWRQWPLMIFITWWCVDGCYALYWTLVDPNALEIMREANWPASLSLFWMCGLVWYWNGSFRDLLDFLKEPRKWI
jgi:hypothetical protein